VRRPAPGPGFLDALDAMSDEALGQIIDGHPNTVVGMGFWIDELNRRRSARSFDQIAEATRSTAEQLDRLADLTARQAAEGDRMRRLTVLIAWLTAANVVVAGAALAIALSAGG
jgi:hypothetical protein